LRISFFIPSVSIRLCGIFFPGVNIYLFPLPEVPNLLARFPIAQKKEQIGNKPGTAVPSQNQNQNVIFVAWLSSTAERRMQRTCLGETAMSVTDGPGPHDDDEIHFIQIRDPDVVTPPTELQGPPLQSRFIFNPNQPWPPVLATRFFPPPPWPENLEGENLTIEPVVGPHLALTPHQMEVPPGFGRFVPGAEFSEASFARYGYGPDRRMERREDRRDDRREVEAREERREERETRRRRRRRDRDEPEGIRDNGIDGGLGGE
jgi:hypothetical protein